MMARVVKVVKVVVSIADDARWKVHVKRVCSEPEMMGGMKADSFHVSVKTKMSVRTRGAIVSPKRRACAGRTEQSGRRER